MTTYLKRRPTTTEPFSLRRYNLRTRCDQMIAKAFDCIVGSGRRTSVPPGGSTTSLHLEKNGALGRDLSGTGSTEAARQKKEVNVAKWAAVHPEIYQEVLAHDAGSGFHAHYAYNAKLRGALRLVHKALVKDAQRYGARPHGAAADAASQSGPIGKEKD